MPEAGPVRPGPEEFRELASSWPLVPMWTELLADVSTPVGVFPALAGRGPGVLLESVERSERWGRYSFVAGDPAALVTVDRDGIHIEGRHRDGPSPELPDTLPPEPLAGLKALERSLRAPRMPELPALTGGLVGFVSYEAAELLDGVDLGPVGLGGRVPGPPNGAAVPAMQFLLVDRAVVFDHWRQRLLLVVHVPGRHGHQAGTRALEELAERVTSPSTLVPQPVSPDGAEDPRSAARANMAPERFLGGVERIKEHIRAGDIFQAVLSRRLSVPAPGGGLPVYRRLRVTNPAPYMFLLRMPGMDLAGSSPEPLVRVEGRTVVSRPIAGTRPRGRDSAEDLRLEDELLADPKERAEHAMLVDLARNDLGRVCRAGTVRPTELLQVERFSRVMHLVSTVEGELGEGCSALDALAATFPAGTVTGAPKRRAMEIVAEHEPTPRGPYAGAVGYVSFSGDLDFCITIRTAVVQDGVAHVQSGAGIVADSDPERELQETEAKASAVLAAVRGAASEAPSAEREGPR